MINWYKNRPPLPRLNAKVWWYYISHVRNCTKTFNEDVLRKIDKIIMNFYGGYRGQKLAKTYNKLSILSKLKLTIVSLNYHKFIPRFTCTCINIEVGASFSGYLKLNKCNLGLCLWQAKVRCVVSSPANILPLYNQPYYCSNC